MCKVYTTIYKTTGEGGGKFRLVMLPLKNDLNYYFDFMKDASFNQS